MAGEAGRQYERDVYNRMNRAGVVPEGFSVAGTNPHAPDMQFLSNGGLTYNLELKNDTPGLLDFGQGTLQYTGSSWELSGDKTAAAEKMRDLLRGLGVLNVVTTRWTAVPHKRTRQSVTKAEAIQDIINFPDINAPANVSDVISYYNRKDTFYIQIEKLGLYYMGSNPANIPEIPQLSGSFEVRVRRKPTGSTREDPALTAVLPAGRRAKLPNPPGSYRFTTAFICTSPPGASPIDLDNILDWL